VAAGFYRFPTQLHRNEREKHRLLLFDMKPLLVSWSEWIVPSAHPQMALLRDFGVGRHDLNPQNSPLCLRFKSDARLELTQKPSSVNGH